MMPQNVPPSWRVKYADAIWERQTIGESNASVYRLSPPDAAPLFVKSEQHAPLAELPGEIARLGWLAQRGIPCPRILDVADHAGAHWLLMSAVPGHDLASGDLPPDRIIHLYVEALQPLHALNIAGCPFDQRIETQLSRAAVRVAAGLVDEDDFDDDRTGWTATQVLDDAGIPPPPTKTSWSVTATPACPICWRQAARSPALSIAAAWALPTAIRIWRWLTGAWFSTSTPIGPTLSSPPMASPSRTGNEWPISECWTSCFSRPPSTATLQPLTLNASRVRHFSTSGLALGSVS